MLSSIKKHPFAVTAFFERSVVLTFAVAPQEVMGLLPVCLEPDTFNDKWAFIAVAMVHASGLRPKGFPAFMGNDFFLIGYRIFVRYHTNAGKRLRGLYILRSETDSPRMKMMGNIFTHYNYSVTDVQQSTLPPLISISSVRSGLDVTVDTTAADVPLPASSPFATWKEARRFAGPLPFTFSYDATSREVLIIEGVREHWEPQPVAVVSSKVGFIDQMGFKDILPASAFMVQQVPYEWKKGRTEIWRQ